MDLFCHFHTVLVTRYKFTPGFFSQNFWWRLAFGDDFRSLTESNGGGGLASRMESDGGGLVSGTESDEGDLEKLSAEVKNAPYTKIRANFGVFKHKKELSYVVLS